MTAVWPAAVNAALLGTDRAPLTLPPADGPLGTACSRLTAGESDPAAALLRTAAAAGAYRRCGWSPPRTDEPPLPASPAESRPLCSPGAASLLRRSLQGEHDPVVGEWLGLAQRHAVRAPAEMLPELLDLGRREVALRPIVVAVGGVRAAWLAGFNEAWSYAIAGVTPDALVEAWETGAGAARLVAFRELRRLDAERARAELAKTWAQETPADRATFAGALADGLSAADEPFLERALDDRRKEVRQQSAALLARLATSALVTRMVARASPLLSLGKGGLLKRTRLHVTPPADADAPLVRDGVDPKAPQGIGERAWWLAQIVGVVPPSTWTAAWSLEPEEVLKLVDGHEWKDALFAGWLTATERHRDEAWASAIWKRERFARVSPPWNAPAPERVFATVVPPEHVDGELRRSIEAERDSLRGEHPVLVTLLQFPHEWSDELSRAVARRLKEYSSDSKGWPAVALGLRPLLGRAAHAVPVSAIEAFLDGWPQDSEQDQAWGRDVDALTSVLRFRRDVHQAFEQ